MPSRLYLLTSFLLIFVELLDGVVEDTGYFDTEGFDDDDLYADVRDFLFFSFLFLVFLFCLCDRGLTSSTPPRISECLVLLKCTEILIMQKHCSENRMT